MKINEINPHIRFAEKIYYHPTTQILCAPDYHFYYTLSECTIEIEDKFHMIKPDTVIIIPPATPYRIKSAEKLHIVSINFDYTQNHSHKTKENYPVSSDIFDKETIIEKINFKDLKILNEPLIMPDMSHLLKTINTILSEYAYKKQFFREISSGHFKHILIEITRNSVTDNKSTHEINDILDYIHNHYSEDIKNSTLSGIAGYHSYHLNRLMKKATGTTLHRYLVNYRIEAAKQYLRETDHSIFKISELCGYKNFSNFSHDFKMKTGLSPSNYRAQGRHIL